MSTQALKQLLKEPLENKREFKDFQERIYQFLLGVYDAGKIVGFKEGRSAKFIIAVLDKFATGLGEEGNISWGDYHTEDEIKNWLGSGLTGPVDEPQDVP